MVLDNDIRIILGTNLRAIRESKNMKQKEFAVLIGMEQAMLSHVETGKRTVSVPELYRIAMTIGIISSDLLGETRPPELLTAEDENLLSKIKLLDQKIRNSLHNIIEALPKQKEVLKDEQ